jgi:hypothetical protein
MPARILDFVMFTFNKYQGNSAEAMMPITQTMAWEELRSEVSKQVSGVWCPCHLPSIPVDGIVGSCLKRPNH